MNMPKLWISLCLCIGLAGCTAEAVRHEVSYSLGAAPTLAAPGPGVPKSASGKVLQIEQVTAAAWLRGRKMRYRLLYHEGSSVSAYGRARWVAPASSLITQQLLQALADQGAWKAVIGPDATAQADILLRVHLLAFEQDFTMPKRSHAMLRIEATLIDAAANKVIADKVFDIQVPAPSPDAQGGASALGRATRKWIAALSVWMLGRA